MPARASSAGSAASPPGADRRGSKTGAEGAAEPAPAGDAVAPGDVGDDDDPIDDACSGRA
ncbi:hypothetical protein WMF37_41280 [Sorangium sp. So ce291]|uniref:hypothetical protein n=1 Tax=Sorangium sp. So ce291 TaxID=3133294 RepID=UPI003F63A3B1